jgi:hypothetical protein
LEDAWANAADDKASPAATAKIETIITFRMSIDP